MVVNLQPQYTSNKTEGIVMLVRAAVGMILGLCLLEAGQDGTTVFGQVSDHGSPIAGAIVTISNRGFVRSVTTDASGRFTLEPVPPGRYDFRTTAPGYAIIEHPVTLHPGDGHRNWIEVKSLTPVDQQTVSVGELAPRLARN